MQLMRFSDYSLRTLIYLGLHTDRLVTIREVAGCIRISYNHLGKIVHNLASLGYIKTTQGKGGGIRLARPAEEINVGGLVRRTENRVDGVDCFVPESCPLLPACRLRPLLHEAHDAFFSVLDRYTVADLLHERQSLLRLVG
jgi:Rrf2 family nitric oxide-sensitive transcriptional repressor